MRSRITSPRGANRRADGATDLVMGVRYLDRLEDRGAGWKIAHRQMSFEWERTLEIGSQREYPGFLRGRRDGSDPVLAARAIAGRGPGRLRRRRRPCRDLPAARPLLPRRRPARPRARAVDLPSRRLRRPRDLQGRRRGLPRLREERGPCALPHDDAQARPVVDRDRGRRRAGRVVRDLPSRDGGAGRRAAATRDVADR